MEGLVLSELAKDLILNILNILILFLIVKKLAYKPVKQFLDDRKARIDKELADAAKTREEAETTLQSYQELMRQSEQKSEELLQKATGKAHKDAQEITEAAKEQAAQIKQKAIEDAKREKRNAAIDMQNEITELAFDISGKILSREVTDDDNRRLAEAFFENYRAE